MKQLGRRSMRLIVLSVVTGLVSWNVDAGTAGTESYFYDALGRLVKVSPADGTQSAYSYDSAGNRLSLTAGADVTAPSVPTGLTATAASASSINLSWTASTDNIAVSGYRVERCQGANCTTFAQIATPTTPSYSNTGLTPSTSYSYRVRATDAAGNLSGYSATATAVTPADTSAPSAPTNLAVHQTSSGPSVLVFTWTASTDNVGVTGYRLERGTPYTQIAAPTGTGTTITGTGAGSYSFRVRAVDAAGNLSAYSTVVNFTVH